MFRWIIFYFDVLCIHGSYMHIVDLLEVVVVVQVLSSLRLHCKTQRKVCIAHHVIRTCQSKEEKKSTYSCMEAPEQLVIIFHFTSFIRKNKSSIDLNIKYKKELES